MALQCIRCEKNIRGTVYQSYETLQPHHLECLQRQDFPNSLSHLVHKKIGYFNTSGGAIIVGGILGSGAAWHYFPGWKWKRLGIVVPAIFLSCVAFQFFCPDQRKKEG